MREVRTVRTIKNSCTVRTYKPGLKGTTTRLVDFKKPSLKTTFTKRVYFYKSSFLYFKFPIDM